MTIHPYCFLSLFVAGISMAAAVILRRSVRHECTFVLPWLRIWGIVCTFPALLFVILCLPGFEETADRLRESMTGTGFELLTGAAGILPGLLWDEIAERMTTHDRALPFGLPATILRACLIVVLSGLIMIPYCFLFNERRSEAAQTQLHSVDATSTVEKVEPAEKKSSPAQSDDPLKSVPVSSDAPAD